MFYPTNRRSPLAATYHTARDVSRGARGALFPGRRITIGAPNHCGGAEWLREAPKSPNNVASTFFNTVHLLPKDLRFEYGDAKLASCPGRHLTSLHPCRQPTTISVVPPNKKCWTVHNWAETHRLPTTGGQCYWLNNWISHWCPVLSFHWTFLMKDTPDIICAGYEYDFTWLYGLETGYSILVQWEDTTQVYNSAVTEGGARVPTPSPCQGKYKNWALI